jgi:hypothetical protein
MFPRDVLLQRFSGADGGIIPSRFSNCPYGSEGDPEFDFNGMLSGIIESLKK